MTLEHNAKIAEIANVIARSASSLPKKIAVSNHRVGAWEVEDVCDALAMLTGLNVIDGFDGDEVIDSGEGHIKVWAKGEWVAEAA